MTVAPAAPVTEPPAAAPAELKALRKVLEMHYVAYDVSHTAPLDDATCSCGEAWPCATVRAIAEALGGDDAE